MPQVVRRFRQRLRSSRAFQRAGEVPALAQPFCFSQHALDQVSHFLRSVVLFHYIHRFLYQYVIFVVEGGLNLFIPGNALRRVLNDRCKGDMLCRSRKLCCRFDALRGIHIQPQLLQCHLSGAGGGLSQLGICLYHCEQGVHPRQVFIAAPQMPRLFAFGLVMSGWVRFLVFRRMRLGRMYFELHPFLEMI